MTYRFEFGKKDSILLGVGALALGIVLFFAGFLTDRLLMRQPFLPKIAATSASVKPAATPNAPASSTAKPEAPPKDQGPTTTSGALHESAPGGTATSTNNLQLAVQVGAFAEVNKAKHMVEQLQKQGFSPVIASQIGVQNQPVSIVEIGPFSAWEDASQVAQLIGRSLGTRPAIRPML